MFRLNVKKLIPEQDNSFTSFLGVDAKSISAFKYTEVEMLPTALNNGVSFESLSNIDSLIPFIVSQLILESNQYEINKGYKLDLVDSIKVDKITETMQFITLKYISTCTTDVKLTAIYQINIIKNNESLNYGENVRAFQNENKQFNNTGCANCESGTRCSCDTNSNYTGQQLSQNINNLLQTAQSKINEYAHKAENYINSGMNKAFEQINNMQNNNSAYNTEISNDIQERTLDGLGATIPGSELNLANSDTTQVQENTNKEESKVTLSKQE